MKIYPQTVETTFSVNNLRKYNPEYLSFGDMSRTEYVTLFKDFLTSSYIEFFNYAVKLTWIRSQLTYKKQRAVPGKGSGFLDSVYCLFTRSVVGRDVRMVNRTFFFPKLVTYFKDFFPNFYLHNPFTEPEKFKFPYKNISPDFLVTVYKLKDRLEYLQYAEEKNLSYANFLDFVMNQIMCINDELGEERYVFVISPYRNFPPYVMDRKGSYGIIKRKSLFKR